MPRIPIMAGIKDDVVACLEAQFEASPFLPSHVLSQHKKQRWTQRMLEVCRDCIRLVAPPD